MCQEVDQNNHNNLAILIMICELSHWQIQNTYKHNSVVLHPFKCECFFQKYNYVNKLESTKQGTGPIYHRVLSSTLTTKHKITQWLHQFYAALLESTYTWSRWKWVLGLVQQTHRWKTCTELYGRRMIMLNVFVLESNSVCMAKL